MKIIRWGAPGEERFGLMGSDAARDLGEVAALETHRPFTPDWFGAIAALDPDTLPTVPSHARIGACIPRPGTFLCIGLNYSDHADEAGMAAPDEPILFMKASNTCVGPRDDVPLPRGTEKLDWEIELGVVIGTAGHRIARADAMAHVAGYCIVNDLSARDWQLEGTGQWTKGKSFPGAGPTGPWLVTPDELDDPHALDMALSVDGARRQSGSTRTMIFDVPAIIAEASARMTLEPGDIIATGTPPGVGMGHSPAVYLEAGQIVRASISGLGEQTFRIIPPS